MESSEKPPGQPADVETSEHRPARDEQAPAEPQPAPAGSQPERAPADEHRAPSGSEGGADMEAAGLLPYHEADGYRRHWEQIQGSFVDDPRQCCEQADALVIEVLQRMSQIREDRRARLRGALDEGGDTEGLRQAMRQYRDFFEGLLKT
jgi:hypothetical protein